MMKLNSRIAKLDNMIGFIQKGILFIKGTQPRKHMLRYKLNGCTDSRKLFMYENQKFIL